MLIRNVKSIADLEKKKDLQSKLLQIQIDNEELLENRVKNYQNPNKPPPVPPQYKTNAELQKDTTLQQKEVVNNLLSINGVDNFLALGVSQGLGQLPNGVGNYLIFNKNFPVIKKRLEDIHKSAYGIDTFMNKIQEVLEQIELGILYNTTGGANARTAFNQAVGAGNNLPSADLYGLLVAKLIAIRDEPTSPLQKDPDFIAIINIYQNLMNNSPSQTDITDIDYIEPLDKQRILKEIDRLMNIRGIPNNADITAVEGDIDTVQYFAGLQQANQFAFPPQGVVLDQRFKDAYANLVRLAKNIKDPNSTIPDLGKLKNRIEKSLEDRRAVQKGLETQLVGVQQAGIQGLRNVVIGDMNTRFERTLNQKSGVRMKERFVSNTPNPYTNQLYGNDMFDYSPTLSNQPPDPTNPADIIVEVVVSKVYGAVKLPYFVKRNLIYGIMDGDGAELTKADGTFYNSIEEFKQTYPELDRYYYRNMLEINEITQQEQDAYNAYVKAEQEYQAQAGIRAKSQKALANYLKKNPNFVLLAQPVQVAQPQQTERLIIGNEANIQAEPTYSKFLTRLKPAGMRARSNIEIDALKQVLQTDPLYDPVADQQQQLIQSQGYGLKKMRGGMKKPDAIHIDINSHNGENYKMSGDGFISKKIKIGKGIEVQEQPRYKTFGKYIVHIPHLENDNVLNFKFPSMGSIPTLKPVSVDDNFKEFIIDILNTGKVSQRHYDTLTEPEKAHFNKVIKGAGLTNSLQFKTDSKIDEKKDIKRLDILLGEINAGNDNEKLRKECKELIKKCVNNGSIPKHKGMDFLLQIE